MVNKTRNERRIDSLLQKEIDKLLRKKNTQMFVLRVVFIQLANSAN